MKIREKIEYYLKADRAVADAQLENYTRNQYVISLLAAGAFFLLTLFNVFTRASSGMFWLTAASSLLLFTFTFISKKLKSTTIIQIAELIICVGVFTVFTLIEGNQGFAVLWMILAPYVMFSIINLKFGLFAGIYLLVLLITLFWTPLRDVIGFTEYTETFMIRFPVLYLISLIFALFSCTKVRDSQYHLLLQQEELNRYKENLEDEVKRLFEERDNEKNRASHDELTGLFNRVSLQEFIEDGKYNSISSCGVAFFDINNLKKANDSYGHSTGDMIIKTVADSLDAVSNPRCQVFRLGGDEFLMIVSDCVEHEMTSIIEHWRVLLDEYNHDLVIPCSVACGYAYASGEFTVDELMKTADKNMYAEKRNMKAAQAGK